MHTTDNKERDSIQELEELLLKDSSKSFSFLKSRLFRSLLRFSVSTLIVLIIFFTGLIDDVYFAVISVTAFALIESVRYFLVSKKSD